MQHNIPHFTMRQLINAGVHFGHTIRRWNPKMKPYLFGIRNGVHIIDLQQTVPLLHQALLALHDTAAKGGRILFVGTKRQAQERVAEAAQRCGQYYVNQRWLGGMLTNWKTISNSIGSLKQLDEHLEKHKDALTKKETLQLNRERQKLEMALGGIKNMGGQPDLIVVFDTNKEAIAIEEATKLRIPIIAILDSNSDPDGVVYPVPGNDDASRSIELYCNLFSDAVIGGLQREVSNSGVDIGAMENLPVAETTVVDDATDLQAAANA